MEHNQLEIILLACGVLFLVALLSVVLWLGNRKRNQERRESQESQRMYSTHTKGRACLFNEVFPDHPDHDPPLLRLHNYYTNYNPTPSFVATVRRRSQTFSGDVQHELKDIRHSLRAAEGQEAGTRPVLDGSEVGLSEELKSDAEANQRRGEANLNAGHDSRARRRTSSGVRLNRLKPRKSQDDPLTSDGEHD